MLYVESSKRNGYKRYPCGLNPTPIEMYAAIPAAIVVLILTVIATAITINISILIMTAKALSITPQIGIPMVATTIATIVAQSQ